MKSRNPLMALVADILGSGGRDLEMFSKKYSKNTVENLIYYKTKGKPFPKGKRNKSLKSRSNRRKRR